VDERAPGLGPNAQAATTNGGSQPLQLKLSVFMSTVKRLLDVAKSQTSIVEKRFVKIAGN